MKKVERLSQLILINPAALTLLILFNIPGERIHKSDGNLDPNSQRDNLQNSTLFSLSNSNSKVICATF